MKRLLILLILLFSYSCTEADKNNNSPRLSEMNDSDITLSRPGTKDWAITMNESYKRTAKISVVGTTPDGEARTSFELHCPTKENKETSFTYIVWNPSRIVNFNFDYFEGSKAAALKEKLVEIQADSPDQTMKWQFSAEGQQGGFAEELAFEFSPSTFNNPERTKQFAQLIAQGAAAVTITVFDNNQKVIKSTFPPIGASSEVAKILNGCQL